MSRAVRAVRPNRGKEADPTGNALDGLDGVVSDTTLRASSRRHWGLVLSGGRGGPTSVVHGRTTAPTMKYWDCEPVPNVGRRHGVA